MARESRDQRLAQEMRKKHEEVGRTYQSATDKARSRGQGSEPKSPVVGRTSRVEEARSGLTHEEAQSAYDQVRSTPASQRRRGNANTVETRDRWRKSVKDRWRA